jgi:hypothetical protein
MLTEGARVSGLTLDYTRELVRKGKLRNVGRAGSCPRGVRRVFIRASCCETVETDCRDITITNVMPSGRRMVWSNWNRAPTLGSSLRHDIL